MLVIIIVIVLSGMEIRANDLMDNGKKCYDGGDFRKAAGLFELYVRSFPGSAEGYEWLGKAYYRLGNNEFVSDSQMLEKAAEAFRKVLAITPGNSAVHFDLGMTYLFLEYRAEALKEFELLKVSDKALADRLLERIRGYSPPPAYRVVNEYHKDSQVTGVTIVGNQVLVPVILAKDGNEVRATLLLDTGASVTSIHSDVAARLGINPAQTQKTVSQVAGGGLLDVWRTRLSYITVGPHRKAGMDVVIVMHKGPPVPFEGLLGMNFLRDLRYSVDFRNRAINWNP